MAVSLSDLVPYGSLIVAAAALWRAGRVRVLDLRTKLRIDVADLRIRLEQLRQSIPGAVQSRLNANSAIGGGGASQAFKTDADADVLKINGLLDELGPIAEIRHLASYGEVEAKLVEAQQVRSRFQQLADKYTAAKQYDAAIVQHRRDSMTAITAARIGRAPDSQR